MFSFKEIWNKYSSASIKKCIECPEPWKLFKGNCVLYFRSPRNLSWLESQVECKKNGAELLDVQPENYLEFIDRFTKTMQITNNFYVTIFYLLISYNFDSKNNLLN